MSTQVRDKVSKHDAFITEQLHRAEQRIRLVDLATAGGGWLAASLGYAVVLMLLDRAFVLSAATRQTLFLAYAAASLAYLYYFVARPLRWRVNPHFAARQLEQTLAGNRNHVINWIDLRSEKVPGTIKSALGQRAAKDLANTDVDDAISSRRAAAVCTTAGVLLGVLVALFLIFGPGPFRSLFGRAVFPFGAASGIATRTQVSIVRPEGGDAVVTIGSPVTIVAEVTGRRPGPHDKDAPSLLYRHDDNEPYRRRFLNNESGDHWVTTVAPLDVGTGFSYKVAAGDSETAEYRVSTRAAPLIADFLATYHYRPYVQRAARSRTTRKLEDLRGTEVHILARTNRVVKDGRLDFDGDDGQGALIRAEVLPDDPKALRFRLVLDRPGKYRLRFTSAEGEPYLDTVADEVKPLPDHTPSVELSQPGKDIEAPVNGHVELAGEATDDIGVAAAALRVQHVGGVTLQAKPYLADTLGKGEFGTPRKLKYADVLDFAALKDEQGKAFEAKPGMQLEYWLEAADACDFPGPNVGVSKRFKVTLTAAKDPEQQKKDKQAAEQRQQKQQRQQESDAKNEKNDRDHQRKQEEQQEKNDTDKRDQDRQNAGQGGANKEESKDPKEGNEPNKDPKEKEPEGDKQGGQPNDDKTLNQADDLKKALEKREKEKGKGQQEKGKEDKPDEKDGDGKAGEARGASDDKPGEAKGAGEKKPDQPPDKGEPKGAQGKSNEPAKDDSPKPDEGKPGDKPRPGEGKPAGKPEQAREAGEKKPGGETKPGEKQPQGEAKDSKEAGNPTGAQRPAEKKEGAKEGGEPKGEGKPGDKPESRPMNADNAANKPAESKDTPKDGKPGECKDCKGGGDGAKTGGSGGKPGENKGTQGDPKDATKGDVEAKAEQMRNAAGQAREQAKRDLQAMAEKANDPAAREAAKQALAGADKGDGTKPADQDGPGAAKGQDDGKGKKGEDPNAKGRAEAGKGGEPGGATTADRPPAGDPADREQPAVREKAEKHRASEMQLEQFRKRVNRDVLRDAKMSEEQYKQFLKDYADLARRRPPAVDDREMLPAPGSRPGALPSLASKPIKPTGQGAADDVRGEGRPKPPPEYRESHADFLQRLQRPSK